MNFIFVLIDTMRYDFLGFNGNKWIRTPNMDRLAERGVVFDDHYIGSYPCMPARREIWTGKQEFLYRGWGPLKDNDVTLPQIMKENGYVTSIITDHFHFWEKGSGNYLFDFDDAEFIRGEETDNELSYRDTEVKYFGEKSRMSGHKTEEQYAKWYRNASKLTQESDWFAAKAFSQGAEWLERNHNSKFFLMFDIFEIHEPFFPPPEFREMYDRGYKGEEFVWPTYGENNMTEEETRHVRALYAGEISFVDRWLGKLFDKMDELGLWENTTVVLTTDHGHMFGEHGLMGKPHAEIADSNLYRELSHIPLVIKTPDSSPKRISGQVTQTADVFPTILDLAGIENRYSSDGESLSPYVDGRVETSSDPAKRRAVIFGRYGEALGITDGTYIMSIWPKPGSSLYWHGNERPKFLGDYYLVKGQPELVNGEIRYNIELSGVSKQFNALYNLKEDPEQKNNLFDSDREKVDEMFELLSDKFRELGIPAYIAERYGVTL